MHTDPAAMPEGAEPPPRGVRTMAAVRWALLAVIALVAAFAWGKYTRSGEGDASSRAGTTRALYHCPMHPQIVSDRPGECPICHMQLEPIAHDRQAKAREADAAVDAGARSTAVEYTCPMHPEVRQDHPGTCPICGMRLEPRAVDAGAAAPAPGMTPPGTAPIELTLDRAQAIGVRTAVAQRREAGGALRVTAVVEAREQGIAEVHVRAQAFVEEVLVGQTGETVKAGQPLFTYYSPEIDRAQAELLTAKRWTGDAGAMALDAAKRKLVLLGVAKEDVEAVMASGVALRAVRARAPIGGVVTKKGAVLGAAVGPEAVLYEIQDLSRVYVVADVFPRDVARIPVGTPGELTVARDPSVRVEAKVDLVYPAVNAEARTTRVRMQVANAGRRLLPGDYGTVTFALPSRAAVLIPRDAVVDTGTSSYVFVVAGARYEPRVVTLGGETDDGVVVDAGLREGERVVSGATFLVDSESRLRASIEAAGERP